MSLLDKATIIPIEAAAICHYEEIAIPFIKKALEQTENENTLDGILSDIANHKRQLFLIKSENEFIAGVVTQVFQTESGMTIGEITMAGGRDYHLWDHFTDSIGVWFKAKGCQKMQVIGRAAWEKLLSPKGFVKQYTILRREL